MKQERPYGMGENGARCINSELGTFNHECNRPTTWIGTKANGFQSCFCDSCKADGHDARNVETWQPVQAEG